jgi:hypothetical protein
MFSLKHLLMGVYQVFSNKSPWVKIGPAGGQGGALYTGERLQGHHGPLVCFFLLFCKHHFALLFLLEYVETPKGYVACFLNLSFDVLSVICRIHYL